MKVNAIYRLLEDPPVYLSIGPKQWPQLPVASTRGYVLAHPMWFFGPKSILPYRRHAAILESKNLQLVMLHNSRIELEIARLSGVPGVLLNQNMHACEHYFRPMAAEIKYDAIYTAQAARYKRIHLALGVPRLFVLTYFWPDIRDERGDWNLGLFDKRLVGVSHNRDRIEAKNVPKLICSARCGLALSRVEGAMWASIEYLLCGLPVVTTWSMGGRDFYLDRSNSIRVSATRQGVRDGVSDAIRRCIPATEIRTGVLARMAEQRAKFTEFVESIAKRGDISSAASTWWTGPDGIHSHRFM